MKDNLQYLDELSPSSKAYKVKVRVIDKYRPRTSPKKLVYQNLVLQDEKGNKMRGALFGDQVDGYKDTFVYNGVYEISNAPIKPGSEKWQTSPDELACQMSFGRQTVVQPVPCAIDSSVPEYVNISQIPRAGCGSGKYDILGIILYVEEKPRTVVGSQQRQCLVREIVITDHSSEQPLTISVWDDLAGSECDALSSWTEKYVVVGFTALRTTTHKGFSMATSMSTSFVHQPTGDRAKSLGDWALQHEAALAQRQARVLDVRNPSDDKLITTLYALKLRKFENTLQEERRWLRVMIPGADLDQVYAYIGCSKCNRRCPMPLDTVFTCAECNKEGCVSTPKVTFACEMVDETSTMSATMFTPEVEVLFRMSAPDVYHMKHSGDLEAFKRIETFLQATYVLVQVGPTNAFSRSSLLQWVPKKVVLEGPETVVQSKNSELAAIADDVTLRELQVGAKEPNKENSEEITSKTAAPLRKKITKPRKQTKGVVIGAHNITASSDPNETAAKEPFSSLADNTTNPNINNVGAGTASDV